MGPEDLGLAEARGRRIREVLQAHVERARLPSAVVGIARRGRATILEPLVADSRADGAPIDVDQPYWIASMTKPVVAVAALALVERGELVLGDEVTRYLPELDLSRVAPGGDMSRAPVKADPVTILDLMRHTSGMVEGLLGTTDVHAAYAEAVGDGMTSFSGTEFVERLSGVPLFNQPGELWHYGWGYDVLGLIIERVTGVSLGEVLHHVVLEPLEMTGTSFGRHARAGALLPGEDRHSSAAQGMPDLRRARFDSGGAGLVSTARDYLTFAAMLVGHGSLGGTDIISPHLAAMMLSQQLPDGTDTSRLTATTMAGPGYGFGLGLAVRRTGGAPDVGSVGEFTWPGAGGSYWWGDPREDLAVVLMMNTTDRDARTRIPQVLRALIYQAIPRA